MYSLLVKSNFFDYFRYISDQQDRQCLFALEIKISFEVKGIIKTNLNIKLKHNVIKLSKDLAMTKDLDLRKWHIL